jgi:hypothetical protein
MDGRYRRTAVAAAYPGEGPFTEPTPAVRCQQWDQHNRPDGSSVAISHPILR